jgi:hypothetical protein
MSTMVSAPERAGKRFDSQLPLVGIFAAFRVFIYLMIPLLSFLENANASEMQNVLLSQEEQSKFPIDDLYDYDPEVVTKAFNLLGSHDCPMKVEKLRHAASYSIRNGDKGFLSSDFSKQKLSDLAFEFLLDEAMSIHHFEIAKILCDQKENTKSGEDVRFYLLSRVCKLTKDSNLVNDAHLWVKLFCENVSVKFIRKQLTAFNEAFREEEAIRAFVDVRKTLEIKRGLSVELFLMLTKEAKQIEK